MKLLKTKFFLGLATLGCLVLAGCDMQSSNCCANNGQKKSLFGNRKRNQKCNCSKGNAKCSTCDCECASCFTQSCRSPSGNY